MWMKNKQLMFTKKISIIYTQISFVFLQKKITKIVTDVFSKFRKYNYTCTTISMKTYVKHELYKYMSVCTIDGRAMFFQLFAHFMNK